MHLALRLADNSLVNPCLPSRCTADMTAMQIGKLYGSHITALNLK